MPSRGSYSCIVAIFLSIAGCNGLPIHPTPPPNDDIPEEPSVDEEYTTYFSIRGIEVQVHNSLTGQYELLLMALQEIDYYAIWISGWTVRIITPNMTEKVDIENFTIHVRWNNIDNLPANTISDVLPNLKALIELKEQTRNR